MVIGQSKDGSPLAVAGVGVDKDIQIVVLLRNADIAYHAKLSRPKRYFSSKDNCISSLL